MTRRSRVLLYGSTPPRAGTPPEQVAAAADKLAARLRGLPLDGVVVYDIQDETGRTGVPRPFPFVGTVDPRDYAKRFSLARRSSTRRSARWTRRSGAPGSRPRATTSQFLSIVGRPASGVRYPLPLSRAIRIATEMTRFIVGGVVIAERHDDQRSEAARLLAKGIEGCGYFISQAVYHAPPTQRLLADYLRDCRGAGTAPKRIVLTFAPVGREKTLAFMRWLGVNIAPRNRARDPRRGAAARRIDRDLPRQPAPHPRRRLCEPYPSGRERRERLDQPRRDRRQRGPVPRA